MMDKFSEKSLIVLGDFYVYGLIDPRTNQCLNDCLIILAITSFLCYLLTLC